MLALAVTGRAIVCGSGVDVGPQLNWLLVAHRPLWQRRRASKPDQRPPARDQRARFVGSAGHANG